MQIKGLSAIVTGSTSGIGLAIASRLAAGGADVVINGFGDVAVIQKLVDDIKSKHGVCCYYDGADLMKHDEISKLIERAEKDFGKVDILVNNAGIQFVSPLEEFPADKWDAVIATNLSAAFHTTKYALKGMKSRGFGRIINIASAHGLVASSGKAAYVAAKHGIIGLTKVTALETADWDITANSICPGWVDTPLVRKQIDERAAKSGKSTEEETKSLIKEKQPKGEFTKADDIAELVVYLCGAAAKTITGASLPIDGAWTAQ